MFLIFQSCMVLPEQNYDCLKNYKKRPLDKKEHDYIFGFRPKSNYVFVDRINYEYRNIEKFDPRCIEFSNLDYSVYFEEPKSSFQDKKYLENQSKLFFTKLYNDVLEDSIIYAIESYQIHFRNFKSDRAHKGGYFVLIISKKEMAKLNGFYIKKTETGLKRVFIKMNTDIDFEYIFFNPIK